MIATLIAANTVAWLVIHLSIAAIVTRVDARNFATDNLLYRTCPAEIILYRNWLHIRRWKNLLPDGAPWVGGTFSKKHLGGRNAAYLRQFALETRRGEAAHWLMLTCCPVFFLWNPAWAWPILALYAAAANLPCIAVQRYNRQTIQRILARSSVLASEIGSGFSPDI